MQRSVKLVYVAMRVSIERPKAVNLISKAEPVSKVLRGPGSQDDPIEQEIVVKRDNGIKWN